MDYQPCPFDRYQHSYENGTHRCERCSDCPRGYQIRNKCTSYNDTVCEPCPSGWYNSLSGSTCKPCAGCGPGTYIRRHCSSIKKTVCRKCPKNTYTAKLNVTLCLQCKRCHPNQDQISVCRGLNDTVCGNCKAGYFRVLSTGECLPCSQCPKVYHHLVVPECREKQGIESSHICWPGHSYNKKPYLEQRIFDEIETYQEDIVAAAIDSSSNHTGEPAAREFHAQMIVMVSILGVILALCSIAVIVYVFKQHVQCKERHVTARNSVSDIQSSEEITNVRIEAERKSFRDSLGGYSSDKCKCDISAIDCSNSVSTDVSTCFTQKRSLTASLPEQSFQSAPVLTEVRDKENENKQRTSHKKLNKKKNHVQDTTGSPYSNPKYFKVCEYATM